MIEQSPAADVTEVLICLDGSCFCDVSILSSIRHRIFPAPPMKQHYSHFCRDNSDFEKKLPSRKLLARGNQTPPPIIIYHVLLLSFVILSVLLFFLVIFTCAYPAHLHALVLPREWHKLDNWAGMTNSSLEPTDLSINVPKNDWANNI